MQLSQETTSVVFRSTAVVYAHLIGLLRHLRELCGFDLHFFGWRLWLQQDNDKGFKGSGRLGMRFGKRGCDENVSCYNVL